MEVTYLWPPWLSGSYHLRHYVDFALHLLPALFGDPKGIDEILCRGSGQRPGGV